MTLTPTDCPGPQWMTLQPKWGVTILWLPSHVLTTNPPPQIEQVEKFPHPREGVKEDKGGNLWYFIKLPFWTKLSLISSDPSHNNLPKFMTWNFLSWEQRIMKLCLIIGLPDWQPFERMIQQILFFSRLKHRCTVAFTGGSIMKYMSIAILLALANQMFSWYFRVLELPVKHKYESVPRIGIDNSDS